MQISFTLIPTLAITSQQTFAHATTVQLWCHVQNVVAIPLFDLDETKSTVFGMYRIINGDQPFYFHTLWQIYTYEKYTIL